MATVPVNTFVNVDINFELAGVDKRLLAWLIDFAIRLAFLYTVGNLFNPNFHNEALQLIYRLCIFLPLLFYFLLFELLMNGQTPGKKILKIKVISLEGYKPTYIQYLNRWIFRLIDLGFITIIFFGIYLGWVYSSVFLIANIVSIIYMVSSKKEQRIGDILANTVVIRLKPKTAITDTIFIEIEDKNYKVKYDNAIKLSDRDISIIKNALKVAEKNNRYENLWNIAFKIQPVINAEAGDDPYY